MRIKLTDTELEALSFFFKEFKDTAPSVGHILDDYFYRSPDVTPWRTYESLSPRDMSEAVTELVDLLTRAKRQRATL